MTEVSEAGLYLSFGTDDEKHAGSIVDRPSHEKCTPVSKRDQKILSMSGYVKGAETNQRSNPCDAVMRSLYIS
jgi:hypothetical protein